MRQCREGSNQREKGTNRVSSTLEEDALSLVVETQVKVQRHLDTSLVLASGTARFNDGTNDGFGIESRGLSIESV